MSEKAKVQQATVSLKMPITTQKFIAAKAAERGVSLSFLIRKMIVEYARDPRHVDSHCPDPKFGWIGEVKAK